MTEQFFPYEVDTRWSLLFKALKLHEHDGVTVTDEHLIATFGRARVKTPLSNVKGTSISGPHRWYTAVGLRLSFTDDGLTFGTHHLRGLCIEFVEPIPKRIGLRDHSALWVSVADPEGLQEALSHA